MTPQHTILLVDDEEPILEIAASILEGEGYSVKTAINVKEALAIVQDSVPDLIVSDVNMPGESGFDFYRHVRSFQNMQQIPFIFLTGNSDWDSIKEGKELGSDDYLTKPVDYYILLSVIKGKLKRRDQLRESQKFQIEEIKNHLFRLISHEMRTPLTSILGATEVLSDPGENLSREDLTTFLMMLQNNSKRLTRMVDDFLLATKIESGELRNEFEALSIAVDPAALFERLIPLFGESVEQKNIKLKNEAPHGIVHMKVYLPHVEDIIRRLIENGIKFSNPGSTVGLSFSEDEHAATFIVKDEGCGIPKSQHTMLFEKFQQLDREKNEQQGTGLGLYIAYNLTLENMGKLRFDSDEGKGSTFYVTFKKTAEQA